MLRGISQQLVGDVTQGLQPVQIWTTLLARFGGTWQEQLAFTLGTQNLQCSRMSEWHNFPIILIWTDIDAPVSIPSIQ
jgi:hypothetical protein